MSFVPSNVAKDFGRRRQINTTSKAQPSSRPALQPGISAISNPETGRPLTARYNWKIGVVGVSTLVFAYKSINFGLTYQDKSLFSLQPGQVDTVAIQFLIAGVIAALIGIAWLSAALLRAPALTINARGVEGFTLYGTRFIGWDDISRIELHYHHIYKAQVTFHSVWGSPTGGWIGIVIPVKIAAVDQPLARILDAVKSYRPNVTIEQTSKPPTALQNLLIKFYEKALGHH